MTKKKITTVTTTEIVDDANSGGGKRTYLALILDESGSMESVKDDTIGGFNTAIDGLKELADLGGETFVSLVTFGGNVRTKLMNAAAKQLERLDQKKYRPQGGTPMLDAIGQTLAALEAHDSDEGNVAFKVTIITDGQENASREYSEPQIAEKIKKLEATGRWTIELIGANVDIAKLRAQTGIGQTYSYVSNDVGTQNAFSSYNHSNTAYMASRGMGMSGQSVNSFRGASASLGGNINTSSPEYVAEMKRLADEALAEMEAKKRKEADLLAKAQKRLTKDPVLA